MWARGGKLRKWGVNMAKYKVCFNGYIIVKADSLEKALENAYEDFYLYQELEYTAIEKYYE